MTEPTEEPHSHTIGAFEPTEAFGTAVASFIALLEAVRTHPGVLPANETLRAAQTAMDTIEVVAQMTISGIMSQIMEMVTEEEFMEHHRAYHELMENMTPEEHHDRRMDLMRRITTFIPYETVHPTAD